MFITAKTFTSSAKSPIGILSSSKLYSVKLLAIAP